MPLMDEFKEERAAMKDAPFKEKAQYFWTYYKWHVIISVCAIFFVVSLTHTILTRKDNGFYVVMLNGYAGATSEDYSKEVTKLLDLDSSKEQVIFDSGIYIDFVASDQRSMTSAQKIMVYLSAKELDVMIGEGSTIQHYAYSETFPDLREFLTPKQVEKYQDRFIYFDRKILTEKAAAVDEGKSYDIVFPKNPTDPTTMEDPVPFGIDVSDCKDITNNFAYADPKIYICPIVNTTHKDRVLTYIDSLFD